MQTQDNQADAAVWREIAPLLDDAMGKLGETDRTVLVLRFFEGRTNAETAAALGLAEGAVQKRVLRALEKLRASFAKQGVTHTAQAIAGTVTTNAVQVAPAGLLLKVSLLGAKGLATTASITTLVKGTLKTLAWTKPKIAMVVGAGVLFACGVAIVAFSSSTMDNITDPAAEAILSKVFEKYASLSTYSDSGKSFTGFSTNTFSIKLGRPDLYRMEWDAVGRGTGISGAAWSAGDGHFQYFTGHSWKDDPQRYHRIKDLGNALEGSGNISGGAALTIPPIFYGKNVSDGFGLLGLCSNFLKQDDAKIGDIDCYVLKGHLKAWRDIPISIWIGKDDLLIRQIQRTTLDPNPIDAPPKNSPEFKKLLAEFAKATTPKEKAAIQQKVQMAGARFTAKTRKPTIHTEIHENIIVNQGNKNDDYVYPVPAGIQPYVK